MLTIDHNSQMQTIPSQIPLPPSPPPKHAPLTTPSDDIITTTNIDHTLEDGNTVRGSSDRRQGATSEIQGSPPSLPSATSPTATATSTASSTSATSTMPPRASSSSQSDTDQPRFRLVQSSSSTNIRNLKGILLVRSASTPPSIPTAVPISVSASTSTSTSTARTSSSSSNDSSNTPPTPPNCENRNNTSTKDSDSTTLIPPIPSNTIMSVTFAPLPQLTPRKRTSTVQLGVAARSQMLRARRGFPIPSDPSSTSTPPNSYPTYSTPGQPRSSGSRSIWGGGGGPKFASEMGGMLGGGIPGLEGIRGGYGGPYGYGYQGGVSNVPGEGIQVHYQGGVQRKSYAWAESPNDDEDEGTAHSGCGPSSGGTGTGTKRPAVAGAGGEEGFVTLGRMVRGGARSLWRSFSVGSGKDKDKGVKGVKGKGGAKEVEKGVKDDEGVSGEEKAKVGVKGGKTEPQRVQGEEERQGLEREESVTVRVLAVDESPPKLGIFEKGKGLEQTSAQPATQDQPQAQAQPHSEKPRTDAEETSSHPSVSQPSPPSPPSHTDNDDDDEDEDGKAQIEQVEFEVEVDGVGVEGVDGVSEEVVRELGVGEYDVVRSLRVDEVDEEEEGDGSPDVAEEQEDDPEAEGEGVEKLEGDVGEHEEVEVGEEGGPEPKPEDHEQVEEAEEVEEEEEEEKGHVWLSEVDPNALRRRIERAQSEQSLRQSAKNGGRSGSGGGLVRRFSSLRIGGGGR